MLLLLGAVGCGSGSPEPDRASPTKAEFIERANLICERNNEILRKAMIEAFGPDEQPDDRTGIRFTRRVWVPNLRAQVRDIRALGSPIGDRARIESMLAGLERATAKVQKDPALASHGPFDKVTRELTAYGIGPCGSP